MADGEIVINTKVDDNGVDKGLNNLKSKLNTTSKTINATTKETKNLSTSLKNISTAGIGATAAIGTATATLKKMYDGLKDCNEAYKVQLKAENALENAAKNNPYLNEESVSRLKEYAGELQKISNYGDEATIKVMSQLAATGRTEEEITKIMSAAADYAAATNTDLSSAAQTLNATFSGMSGTLGRQIDGIKDLTAEELKNGKAIDLIAQKYKGFAESTADANIQVKNAFGDFKESLGKIAAPTFDLLDQRGLNFWQNMTSELEAFNKKLQSMNENFIIGGTYRGNKDAINEIMHNLSSVHANRKEDYLRDTAEAQNDVGLKQLINHLELQKKLSAEERLFLSILKDEQAFRDKRAERLTKETELQKKLKDLTIEQLEARKKEIDDSNDNNFTEEYNVIIKLIREKTEALKEQAKAEKELRDKNAQKYIDENIDALQKQIEKIELSASLTGENVDIQDKYNAYLQSYIDLIANSNGLVTENNEVAKKRLEIIKQLAQAVKDETDSEEKAKKAQELYDNIKGLSKGNNNIIDQYKNRNAEILELEKQLNDGLIEDDKRRAEAQIEIDKAYAQNKKDLAQNIVEEIKDYQQQTIDVINQAADLMLENSKTQAETEQAILETKYLKGEISEEEYNEKITESKKKAAKEQYKIQMFEWTASYFTALANIAQGVTKAIAQGGVAGLLAGGLVAAAGAVQIASITACKPIPPSFATGGVVGGLNGATMGSDNTYAHVRNGEMIMNANQQRALWDFVDGGAKGSNNGTNIVINNSASNVVSAKPQITKDQIEILIDTRINEGLQSGKFNTALAMANNSTSGDYYGI